MKQKCLISKKTAHFRNAVCAAVRDTVAAIAGRDHMSCVPNQDPLSAQQLFQITLTAYLEFLTKKDKTVQQGPGLTALAGQLHAAAAALYNAPKTPEMKQ